MAYLCQGCGYFTPNWLGRCPQCGEWNTLVEVPKEKAKKVTRSSSFLATSSPISLEAMQKNQFFRGKRLSTGLREVDRVLGGGVVEGSLILLSGDPGIGKSTLLLKIAEGIAAQNQRVLYTSSEESLAQLSLRVERLKIQKSPHFFLFSADCFDDLVEQLFTLKPQVVVVDSIQNLGKRESECLPGSVGMLRELSAAFLEMAKKENVAFFLVGHVTKEGFVAGPKTLEHFVDVVLYLEGDPQRPLRMIRGMKNRFGSTQEVGILEMQEEGLVEILDPSQYFAGDHDTSAVGTARTVVAEGKRIMMIEVQSLVSSSSFDFPRRVSLGMDLNRLHLLLAVLEQTTRLRFVRHDVYVSIGGGVRVTETALDLAVCMSVLSSRLNQSVNRKTVYLGEISLNGAIRPVSLLEQRVQEALRMGAKRLVLSARNQDHSAKYPGIEWLQYHHLQETLKREGFFSSSPPLG